MALGVLSILFIVFIILAFISQYLLYRQRNEDLNLIFIVNVLLSLLFSWVLYTSIATNYTEYKIISLTWGLIGLISFVQALFKKKVSIINKLLLSIAVFGSLLHLIFF